MIRPQHFVSFRENICIRTIDETRADKEKSVKKYRMPIIETYLDPFCHDVWYRSYQIFLNECRVFASIYYIKEGFSNLKWVRAVNPPEYITPSDTYGSEYSPDDAYQDYVYYQNDIPRPSAHDDYFFYADDWDPPGTDDQAGNIKPQQPNQVFTKWHKSYEPLATSAPSNLPGE